MAISTNLIKSFQLSALTTALALAGCGGGGGNDTLPPPSNPGQSNGGTTTPTTNVKDVDNITITKSFDTFILKQDEKFTIIANALKSGKPVEGVIVDAIIPDPATSGIYVITPTPITTNANGEAAIELQIKDLAKATAYLKANSDKLSISVKPTNSKQAITNGTISLTGAAPSISTEITNVINDARSLMLSPSNANFKLEVGTQITVSAFVADSKGGALKNVPVTFDLSNLPSLGIYNLSGSTVNTDDRGIATITLQVMSLDKREDLKNGFQVDAFIDRDIDLKASNRPTFKGVDNLDTNTGSVTAESLVNSIILTPNVDSIPLTIGSTFTLTVTTNDKDNKPISNAPIAFTYPTLAEYGLTVANSSATTNGSGQATVTFTVNSLTTAQKAKLIEGFTVNASSNGKFAQASLTAKNETAESLVNSISLTPSVDTISLTPNAQFSVTATTLGKDGKPVSNAPVAFSYPTLADYGLTIASSSPNTNGSGQAVMTFAVNASLTTAQKAKLAEGFTVNASSNAKTTTAVTLKSIKVATVADIAKVSFFTNKDLTTNTGDTINITAQVRDANNVSLANMPVSFTLLDAAAATGITNTTPLQATTNANGEAVLTLKVGALTPDQKYYLQTSGLSFKATAGAITSSTVTLRTQGAITANSVNTLLLTSDSAIQLALGSKVKVTALAIDKNGAIVPNAQVSFKVPTDSGLVNNTGAVVNTNANGEATIEVEIKDLAKATTALQNGLVVTAQSGVSVGTTTVRGASSNANTQAYNVFVSQSKSEMKTSVDKNTLTIRVTDINGGIKPNVPVYLQLLNDGTKYGLSFDKLSQLITDDKGIVEVNLVQSNVGLISQLDHTADIKIIINDGIYRAEEQTLSIPIKGTNVQDVLSTTTLIDSTQDIPFNVSGRLLDGNGLAIVSTPVELLNNGIPTGLTATTNAFGQFTYSGILPKNLTASDGTYNLSARVSTNGITQTFDLLKLVNSTSKEPSYVYENNTTKDLEVNKSQKVTVTLPKSTANSTVYVSSSKGLLSTTPIIDINLPSLASRIPVVVNSNKQAVFYVISNATGVSTLTTEYTDTDTTTIPTNETVSDNITFVSINPTKLTLQSVNTFLRTEGSTDIIATVKDGNDAPVKNAIVTFNNNTDASGGKLSNSIAMTDANGQAKVTYTAGATSTPSNGVIINATVKSIKIDGVEDTSRQFNLSSSTNLTVQTNASYIGIAFSDKILTSDSNTDPSVYQVYYEKYGSIFVTNSLGQPAVNQPVSLSFIPTQYYKGYWTVVTNAQGEKSWGINHYLSASLNPNTNLVEYPTTITKIIYPNGYSYPPQSITLSNIQNGQVTCASEDKNTNNFLDIGEDINGNNSLDPRNPLIILSRTNQVLVNNQTLITDSSGKLDFKIRYPKEYAQWFSGNFAVTTKVDGSNFVQQRFIEDFPALANDVEFGPPAIRPNWTSPYGKVGIAKGDTLMNIWGNQYDATQDDCSSKY